MTNIRCQERRLRSHAADEQERADFSNGRSGRLSIALRNFRACLTGTSRRSVSPSPMGLKATLRSIAAAERRNQRDSQRRLRDLERQAKEQAKLSAMEQARLEVETHENRLEVLLSVHKEQGETWDWRALAAALPPHRPPRNSRHQFRALQQATLPSREASANELEPTIEQARLRDEQEFREMLEAHTAEIEEWDRMKTLARRIIAGEPKAYTEAVVEFGGLTEISDLGSSIHFTVHNAKLVECVLTVNGRKALPSETKILTAAGKLSVKPMPKSRFHEIYQDYVCGCVLRVAREVFAVLPVETVLVTASVDEVRGRASKDAAKPVLSVAIERARLQRLAFDRIDPSDSIERYLHRGNFKASRSTGEFEPIQPLCAEDLTQTPLEGLEMRDLLGTVRRTRNEIKAEIARITGQSDSAVAMTSPPIT